LPLWTGKKKLCFTAPICNFPLPFFIRPMKTHNKYKHIYNNIRRWLDWTYHSLSLSLFFRFGKILFRRENVFCKKFFKKCPHPYYSFFFYAWSCQVKKVHRRADPKSTTFCIHPHTYKCFILSVICCQSVGRWMQSRGNSPNFLCFTLCVHCYPDEEWWCSTFGNETICISQSKGESKEFPVPHTVVCMWVWLAGWTLDWCDIFLIQKKLIFFWCCVVRRLLHMMNWILYKLRRVE